MTNQPKLVVREEAAEPIPKPSSSFDLSTFKSTRVAMANVGTAITPLPCHRIADAKDFVRLHPDEDAYWSDGLCFVNVPIKGQKRDTMHLIIEDLALRYLPSARVLRFRLALATKPFDAHFLCQIPTQNPDNAWNVSNLQACERAKRQWVQVTSRKGEGVEAYKIDYARDHDAFPEPRWPSTSLNELIGVTFTNCTITTDDHPALLRLIGAKIQP